MDPCLNSAGPSRSPVRVITSVQNAGHTHSEGEFCNGPQVFVIGPFVLPSHLSLSLLLISLSSLSLSALPLLSLSLSPSLSLSRLSSRHLSLSPFPLDLVRSRLPLSLCSPLAILLFRLGLNIYARPGYEAMLIPTILEDTVINTKSSLARKNDQWVIMRQLIFRVHHKHNLLLSRLSQAPTCVSVYHLWLYTHTHTIHICRFYKVDRHY